MCKAITKQQQQCKNKAMPNGYCKVHGGSLMSTVKGIYNRARTLYRGIEPSTKPSGRLEKFLNENSNNPIMKLQLARKPVLSPIQKALDVISLGSFSKMKNRLKYDNVYHNYLLVTLKNGKTYKLEKNETVVEMPATKSDFQNQVFNIPLKGKELTLKTMVDNASKQDEHFWKYRADSNNCQRFTRDMIERNGLLPDQPPQYLQEQNAKALVNTLPGGSLIPNAVTDLAATADRLIHGDGLLEALYHPSGLRYSS